MTLKPLEVFAEAPATGGRRIHGEVMVASLVTLFKKLKFLTDENVGWGPIDLPELELQTTAYWLTADRARDGWRRDDLDVALLGAGRAIQTVASVLLMVDPRDLGLVAQVRSPHAEQPTIYLYESVPGGIGLSERLWDRHDELLAAAADLIEACGCDGGCPACTGPRLEPDVDAQGPRPSPAGRPRGAACRGLAVGRGMTTASADAAGLARRLERFRAATRHEPPTEVGRQVELPHAPLDRHVLAERLAATLDGEIVESPGGSFVRCETTAAIDPGRSRASGATARASRRRTSRSSASTPRRPAWPRRPGPWRSSSGSAGGRRTRSARSSCSCPTMRTSRRS